MPWWSLPTLSPNNNKGYSFRILVVWGTVVIGLLGIGIFVVKNEDQNEEARRRRHGGGGGGGGGSGGGEQQQFQTFGTNGSFSTTMITNEGERDKRRKVVERTMVVVTEEEEEENNVREKEGEEISREEREEREEGEEREVITCSLCLESMWGGVEEEEGVGKGEEGEEGEGTPKTRWRRIKTSMSKITGIRRKKKKKTEDDMDVVRLSCTHLFHRKCVYGWLVEKRRDDCPLCRANVVSGVPAGVHAGVMLHPMW